MIAEFNWCWLVWLLPHDGTAAQLLLWLVQCLVCHHWMWVSEIWNIFENDNFTFLKKWKITWWKHKLHVSHFIMMIIIDELLQLGMWNSVHQKIISLSASFVWKISFVFGKTNVMVLWILKVMFTTKYNPSFYGWEFSFWPAF